MTVWKKIKSHADVRNYFKELHFFNKHIERPEFKQLKSIDLLSELPFYKSRSSI